MKLIPLSPNILINPDCICYIEQRQVGKATVTFVCIGEKEYVLQVPLNDFYNSLGINEQSNGGQYFAG